MNPKKIEIDRGPVEYMQYGSGPAVLVVHGGNDNCKTDIGNDGLAAGGFTVLVPSRPGYGETPIQLGETAGEQAGVMKMFLDKLGIEKVSVIGISAGGPTALEFAGKYPDFCNCLVLEEAVTKTWVSPFSPKYWAMKYIFNPKRQPKLWTSQKNEFRDNRTRHLHKLAGMFSTLKPEKVISDWDEEDIASYEKMLGTFEPNNGFTQTMDHRAKHIDTINIPTLIIHSRFDKNVSFSHAQYANKKIRNSILYEAPTLSHLVYMGSRKNEVFGKRLDFLIQYNQQP